MSEQSEEADNEETIESDEDGYPLLPENVFDLRLSRRKGVLRRFMAAARRLCLPPTCPQPLLMECNVEFYRLNGRIPWAGIEESPSEYISRKSRPDSDHKLQEPSHMKAEGVDEWLRHWLKLQRRNKRPLSLKGGIDIATSDQGSKSRDKGKSTRIKSGGRRKKGKGKAKATEEQAIDEDEE